MSALNYYIDLTPDRHHCPANMEPTAVRRVLLCDDCAAKIRDELSLDYVDPIKHTKLQRLRCDHCLKNGFGEPATSIDLTAAELDPRMAAIDRAAGAIDSFMDRLDEISNPELFNELKAERVEVERLTAALTSANADRDRLALRLAEELRKNETLSFHLKGARDWADDVAADYTQAKENVVRFEAAWDLAMRENGELRTQLIMERARALVKAPDPASSESERMATARHTNDGVGDVGMLGLSHGDYRLVLDLIGAGHRGAAQLVILNSLATPSGSEASPTNRGEVDEADPTAKPGAAAGELS